MPKSDLADRLFVPWERLGWEYVPPAPPVRGREAGRGPVWIEPPVPELRPRKAPGTGRSPAVAIATVLGCSPFGIAALTIGGVMTYGDAAVIRVAVTIFVVLVALGVLRVAVPAMRRRAALAQFRRDRDAAHAEYLAEFESWRKRVARHDMAERARYEAASRWFPLTSWSQPGRIDVFGGTGDGWASLLVTLGCSRLCRGADILLLDLTEQQVGGALAEFAVHRGHPVRGLELPTGLSRWHPLAGLDAEQLSELLADSVHSTRQSAGTADGRALDADLLTAVVSRLDGRWTFRRIAAGLRVLRRTYEHGVNGVLDSAEVEGLTGVIDAFGQSEPVRQELRFLTGVLDLLAVDELDVGEGVADEEPWHASGLTVVRTASTHRRRKDFLDRVVFHRLIHALRDGRIHQDSMVVAGADHLGRESLEELVREAERAGVRLVLMVERLRGDLHDLLGGRDSATVLMRLGNAREAATAAEFVGRGHRFVLSQLTEQVGATFTEGFSAGYSLSEGTSESESRSLSPSTSGIPVGKVSIPIPTVSGSRSDSMTRSRTETWQDTVNQSLAESLTEGRTVSRVYEFTVEPTTLQSLPATAFVLAEAGPRGRRVVLGDCNPGIVLLDRVAPSPRKP